MTSSLKIHRLVLEICFPEGVHPGAGKTGGNKLIIGEDGTGQPILRGTALTGALRHAYAKTQQCRVQDPQVADWFGAALHRDHHEVDHENPSRLKVSDVPLVAGIRVLRQHNAIDRHLGSVRENALFSLESLPPQTKGQAILELEVKEGSDADSVAFLRTLVDMLDGGLTLGGHAARGIGRVALVERPVYRCFDLTDVNDHAAFLDERYARWNDEYKPTGEAWVQSRSPQENLLQVSFTLSVPRGQDFLVGDGQTMDHMLEPQQVIGADGQANWRLPGSSLRGVLRGWMTRLAARQEKRTPKGYQIADSVARFQKKGPMSGDDVAWGGLLDEKNLEEGSEEKSRQAVAKILADEPHRLADEVKCPITRLFGSALSKGRIHVSDALAPVQRPAQVRMHVAVDAITGGANEGFLFSNMVLTNEKLEFPVHIRIEDPTEDEAKWLAHTLQAIHRGIVRIGSSKAGGRLALKAPPQASGPNAETVAAVLPSEVKS